MKIKSQEFSELDIGGRETCYVLNQMGALIDSFVAVSDLDEMRCYRADCHQEEESGLH